MRRPLAVALVVLAVAATFAGAASLLAPPQDVDRPDASATPRIVRLDGHESGVHPYIGPKPSLPGKSPVNLLARANVSAVEDALVSRSGQGWTEGTAQGDADPRDVAQQVGIPDAWDPAEGSVRYAYVHDGQDGQWVRPDEQIQDGAYFGSRAHIRL